VKTPTLKSRDGAAVGKVTIEAFRRGFRGQALLPGDPGYDSARRIWNASIDKHPGLIAQCSDAADIVRAVNFSRANNLLVAVKSGGHNVAGRALCDDGIVIDLSAMNRVSVDPELRTCACRRERGSAMLIAKHIHMAWRSRLAWSRKPASPASLSAAALGGWCENTV
jgi:FAD/FMN-containing dehydrogenase